MRYSSGFVDKNLEDGVLTAAFYLKLNELISLTLNNLLGQLADPFPFDSLSHTNKKVGRNAHSEKRTTQSIGAASG